jgi:hypothetical protein
MKTTHQKLIGGLLISLLIATIGAAVATGQTDDTTDSTTNESTPTTPPEAPFKDHQGMMGPGMCGYNLTDEQQTDLQQLMTSLREQNATPDEMRIAIQEKLDEFGVLDTQLDNEIARTQDHLTILNREKELRDEGYSWNEITSIIEEEFGLENVTGFAMDMIGPHEGPGRGPHGGFQEFTPPEESDQ